MNDIKPLLARTLVSAQYHLWRCRDLALYHSTCELLASHANLSNFFKLLGQRYSTFNSAQSLISPIETPPCTSSPTDAFAIKESRSPTERLAWRMERMIERIVRDQSIDLCLIFRVHVRSGHRMRDPSNKHLTRRRSCASNV